MTDITDATAYHQARETYTVEQIKRAFWQEFHESGELWFSYLGTPEENESHTQTAWREFLDALREPAVITAEAIGTPVQEIEAIMEWRRW